MTEVLDRQDYALVLSDLIAIVTVIEGQMCDLMCFSDPRKDSVKYVTSEPSSSHDFAWCRIKCNADREKTHRKLWAEAMGTIDALLAMIYPALTVLGRRESISGPVPLTTKHKRPLPALHFVNSTRLTFEELRSSLAANFAALNLKKDTFWHAAGRHSIHSSNRMSRRPLSQLVIEAMLRTKRATDLPTMRSDRPLFNPDNAAASRLTNGPTTGLNVLMNRLAPGDQALTPGTVAVVTAIKTNKVLITGGTLIDWGKGFGQLKLSNQNVKLFEWYREQRRGMFSNEDAQLLGALIDRLFIPVYDAKFKNECLLTPPELERTLRQPRNVFELRANHQKYKKTALMDCEQCMDREIWTEQLRRLSQAHHICLGQSYVGGSHAFKRKCPVCTIVYPFPVLQLSIHLEQEYNMVPETETIGGMGAEARALKPSVLS
ncbi:MAG: hypothetical protein Q9198_004363 [Flavoplaca austrocitrina]